MTERDEFNALHATSAALTLRAQRLPSCDRQYTVQLSRDFFGLWLIEFHWGRAGTATQSAVTSTDSLSSARQIIARRLQRRASAPRRIDTIYRLQYVVDPDGLFGPLPKTPQLQEIIRCLKAR